MLTARLVWRHLLPGQKQRGAGFFLGSTAARRARSTARQTARTFGMGPGGQPGFASQDPRGALLLPE
jgi:hypothetical protein